MAINFKSSLNWLSLLIIIKHLRFNQQTELDHEFSTELVDLLGVIV